MFSIAVSMARITAASRQHPLTDGPTMSWLADAREDLKHVPRSRHDLSLKKSGQKAAAEECSRSAQGEWLFIIATGRSGSTSILDSLNALPGVGLRGELDGAIGLAMDLFDIADAESWTPKMGPRSAWLRLGGKSVVRSTELVRDTLRFSST